MRGCFFGRGEYKYYVNVRKLVASDFELEDRLAIVGD
jgi:hypothetical protein